MEQLKILIVDNEPNVLEVMRLGLKMRGLEADTAEDGEQALKALQNTPYDIVLLDLIMPKMNGEEVYHRG